MKKKTNSNKQKIDFLHQERSAYNRSSGKKTLLLFTTLLIVVVILTITTLVMI